MRGTSDRSASGGSARSALSTHIGEAWRAAGLLPIAMVVQCTNSIAPGPGSIRDSRHRLLDCLNDARGVRRIGPPAGCAGKEKERWTWIGNPFGCTW